MKGYGLRAAGCSEPDRKQVINMNKSQVLEKAPVWLCKVSETSEVQPRKLCPKESKEPLAIHRIGEEFFLTEDTCTHALVSLSEGHIEDGKVYCPLHGGAFDIRTGKPVEFPCTMKLKTYSVVRDGDDLYGVID